MRPKLLDVISLFNCSHQFGWPRRGDDGDYYQVCLVCGTEYQYDWTTMQRTAQRSRQQRQDESASAQRKAIRSHRSWRPRERRLRWTVALQFRTAGSETWQEATAENISRTGLLFTCAGPLESGTRVELKLEMPPEIAGQPRLVGLCQARVARVTAVGEAASLRVACIIESSRIIGVSMSAMSAD